MSTAALKTNGLITLYELAMSVEPTGIRILVGKYAMKCTGKNYIPQMLTDELREQGFCSLNHRVPVVDINKVCRVQMYDHPTHIGRYIYFLEGDLDKSKAAIKAELEAVITRMKKSMDETHSAWSNKTPRPTHRPDYEHKNTRS